MKTVQMWTDGGQHGGNPGIGGWAAILIFEEHARIIGGYCPDIVTNNAMETQAVIGGLSALKSPCAVKVVTDSQYVITGIEKVKRTQGRKTHETNRDTWRKYIEASKPHAVVTRKTEGHSDDPLNNLADAIAGYCAMAQKEINVAVGAEYLMQLNPKQVRRSGLNGYNFVS